MNMETVEYKNQELFEQWCRVQGQRQDAGMLIESYTEYLERLVTSGREDAVRDMRQMQEIYGTVDDEDLDGETEFKMYVSDYESVNKAYKELFDNPPKADERGNWPMSYVSELKDAEKRLGRRLADLGRWVIAHLEAHRILHHEAHNHVVIK